MAATNEPIRNWSFFYSRLVGTVGDGESAEKIRTSTVVSIVGNIATTLNSTYVLQDCDPSKTREEWIKHWEHWSNKANW